MHTDRHTHIYNDLILNRDKVKLLPRPERNTSTYSPPRRKSSVIRPFSFPSSMRVAAANPNLSPRVTSDETANTKLLTLAIIVPILLIAIGFICCLRWNRHQRPKGLRLARGSGLSRPTERVPVPHSDDNNHEMTTPPPTYQVTRDTER
jgi:hypothetical protein